jgi:twitching motility two-component system response regulator PilH
MAKILVVDDSPTEVHLLKAALQKGGHGVITATNGVEAIETARNEKPDVILMDVVMPGINGFQATRQITQNPETKHIPVIVVSNKSQQTDRVWGLRQGAADYLAKPVKDQVLLETIRNVLAGGGKHAP